MTLRSQEEVIGCEPAVEAKDTHLYPAGAAPRLQAATRKGLGLGPHVGDPSVILTATVLMNLPLHPLPP